MKSLQKNWLIILGAIIMTLLFATALIVLYQPSGIVYATEIKSSEPLESKSDGQFNQTELDVSANAAAEDDTTIGYCGHYGGDKTNYSVKQYEPYIGNYLRNSVINIPAFMVKIVNIVTNEYTVVDFADFYFSNHEYRDEINVLTTGSYRIEIVKNPDLDSKLKFSDDDYAKDLGNGIPNNNKIGYGTLFIRENKAINGEEVKGEWITKTRNFANACSEETAYTWTFNIVEESSIDICIAYELEEKNFLLYDLHNLLQTHKIRFIKPGVNLSCYDTERKTGIIFSLLLTDKDKPTGVTSAGFYISNIGHGWYPIEVKRNGQSIAYEKGKHYTEKGFYTISTNGQEQSIYVIDENFFEKNIQLSLSGLIKNNIHYYDTDQLKNEQIYITYLKQNDPYAPKLGIKIGETESSFGQTISGIGSYNITIHGMDNLSSESLLTYKMTLKIQNYDARSNYRAMRKRQHTTNYPSQFFGIALNEEVTFAFPDVETAASYANQLGRDYELINADYGSDTVYYYVGFDDTYAPEIPSLNDYKFAFNDGAESVTVNYKRLGEVTQYKNFQYGVSVNDQITESGIYEIHETDAFGNLGVYYAYYAKENLSKIKLTTNFAGIETTLEIGENYSFPSEFIAESFSLWNLRYAIDGYDVDPGAQVIVIKDGIREIYTAEDLNVENAEDLITYSEEGLYNIRFVDRCHNKFQFNVRIPEPEYKLEYTGTTQFEIQSDLKIYIDKSAQDVSIQINLEEQTDLTFEEDAFYRTVVIPRSVEQKFVILKYRSPATGEMVTVNAIILAEGV